jgi:competence protein ComEA
MTREQQWIVLFLSLFLSLFFFLTNPPSTSNEVARMVSQEDPPAKKSLQGEFMVEVDGSVNRRGIYSIGPGMNVLDVIEKAGGINKKVSLSPGSLLTKIEKSCRVRVLSAAEGKGSLLLEPLSPQTLKALSVPIDINTAPIEELDTLPGIGPTIARAIVEHRQTQGKFNSAEDLLQVRGIGPKKLAAILPHITVQEKP